MKLRSLSIAAFVLAALSGVLYWSSHRKPSAVATVSASPDVAPKILSLNQADVVGLVIHRKNQPQFDLSRNDSGTWQINAPEALAADQEAVSNVLTALSSLNSDRLLEDKAADLTPFGFADPALELDVILKNNKKQKLLIGDQTPSNSGYYAVLAGDPRLFTLASYNKSSLDKTPNDLRDKRLLSVDFDKVSQFEIITEKPDKKQNITFGRSKDAWQILKPKLLRADNYQVDELIRSLKDAKIDSTTATDDTKNAAAFKSATPFATAKIIGASGIQELELRKSKDHYYAKSSALPGFHKAPASLATALDKPLDDFCNKKLFDLGFEEPNRIEIHDGAKSYFLLRSGSDWWGPDGKKLDDATVQTLLGKIRDLSAAKFLDSGFTIPALEITVLSNDTKRVEKVSVAKDGDRCIAKRDNEPALYELPLSVVAELQKSAADVKQAPVINK